MDEKISTSLITKLVSEAVAQFIGAPNEQATSCASAKFYFLSQGPALPRG